MTFALPSLLIIALLQANGSAPDPEPAALTLNGDPGCTLDAEPACRLTGQITASEAQLRLGDANQTFWFSGGLLHVVARREATVETVRMCCALQSDMELLDSPGLWAASYQLDRVDEAVLAFWPLPPVDSNGGAFLDRPVYRGPSARPAPPRREVDPERIENARFPSETFSSDRFLTIYTPSGSPPDTGWPTIFVADGGRINELAPIAEALAAQCVTQPVLMVGLWPGEQHGAPLVPDATGYAADARSREYLWTVHPDSFARHQDWLIDELMPMAVARGGSANQQGRMTFGASSGAAWALSTGLLHADMIDHVGGASLGWRPSLEAGPARPNLQILIASGLYESRFNRHSRAVIESLQADGATGRFIELVSGHGPIGFEMAFETALTEAFPAAEGCIPASD
ncbi:alpha/beta hydrolase-fold protein [uncultured Maricaulis sp.]|uniref:alpha/beta hydrolase n=1 Tax=uncultured Maricaulis sp. TaxID=174710 RepID=UPI0026072D39|nr:alpha/beta hydrolase-fold protein [uncultured Maricaulis sp.]